VPSDRIGQRRILVVKNNWSYTNMNNIVYHPIGTIHTPFTQKKDTPIQPAFAEGVTGTVEILPQYTDGLKDIEGFSHIILIYHFDRAEACKLHIKPFLEDKVHGIFAIRHFNRPNPIGFSLVKLLSVKENCLEVQDVDILDNTPLLDIKPYVPQFDTRHKSSGGWVDQKDIDFERGKSGKHR